MKSDFLSKLSHFLLSLSTFTFPMVCSLSFAFFSSAPLFFVLFFFLMNFWEASFWNPWTQGGQRATCMRPQSCPTFCDHMDRSLTDSSVHSVLQVRILEWVAISYSRGSSWPRDWTHVSCISCTAGGFLTAIPSGLPSENFVGHITSTLFGCSFLCETSFPECLGERVGLK